MLRASALPFRHDISNADNVVSNTHNVSNTHPIVPEVRSDMVNIHTTVPDIHHDKLKNRGGQNRAASITHTLTATEQQLATAWTHAMPVVLSTTFKICIQYAWRTRNTHGIISNICRDVIAEIQDTLSRAAPRAFVSSFRTAGSRVLNGFGTVLQRILLH